MMRSFFGQKMALHDELMFDTDAIVRAYHMYQVSERSERALRKRAIYHHY